MRWRKVVSAALALMVFIFGLVSCGRTDDKKISVYDVKNVIFESHYSGLTQLGSAQVTNYYAMQSEWISESLVYVDGADSSCDEVAVFRLSDQDYAKNVIAAVEQRINSEMAVFGNSLESEYKKLQERVLMQKDDLIVLVVMSDSVEISNRLNKKLGFSDISIDR